MSDAARRIPRLGGVCHGRLLFALRGSQRGGAPWGPGMRGWFVVPYDGSPEAHATLQRVAMMARAAPHNCRVCIATVGLDPSTLDRPVETMTRIAGAACSVAVHWLTPTDPIGSLRQLLAEAPDSILVVPLGGCGQAPWYPQACRVGDAAQWTMILFRTPLARRAAQAPLSQQHRTSGLIETLGRTLTRPVRRAIPLFTRVGR